MELLDGSGNEGNYPLFSSSHLAAVNFELIKLLPVLKQDDGFRKVNNNTIINNIDRN